MFKGSNVALITPFKDNLLDEENYIKLINFHIENGTNGLVPAGTTGESPTLNHDEHQKVIEICIKESNGKLPVIAGTGSNSTEEAVSLTKHAEKAGANGVLVVTPYYNKPTQEGLYQHYKAINDNDETIKKLGPEFIQLTGEDGLAFEFNKRGGVGIISVTANVAPKLCSDMQRLSKSKNDQDIKEAKLIDEKLQPLHKALFIESNPAPVKYAAKIIGLCSDEIRLPLVKIRKKTEEEVKKALSISKLIN